MSDEHDKHSGGHVGGHGGGGHDEEEEAGAPEWLISFADMVMLLMGFFVMIPLPDALSFVVLHRPSSSKCAS